MPGKPSSSDPFVPDLSEGAETGVYLALLELLDEGLIITGDEVVLDANSAACSLLERDYRHVAGRPLADLFPSEEAFLAARARVLIQGEQRGQLTFSLPAGGERTLDFIAAPRLRPGIHAIILNAPASAAHAHRDEPELSALRPRLVAQGKAAHGNTRSPGSHTDARAMYLACHDLLTGLPNRRLFEARFDDCVSRSVNRRNCIGVLRIDIDNFKAINKAVGENAGDAALQQLAHRLSHAAGADALIARERSDSFLALLPELDLASKAGRCAEALLTAIAHPISVSNRSFELTASVGIAVFPQDGRDLDTLLRHAKTALTQARRLGGNNLQYFHGLDESPGFDVDYLETGLRHALQHNELTLHFQPLIDTRSRQLRAGEALLRWAHVELGLLPFRRFIGAVSDPALLASLGDWVLEHACRAALSWPAQGTQPALRVTVNITIEQLMHGNFAERVFRALNLTGLPAERLELDLDENVLAEESAGIADTLNTLAQRGVRLAVDDFGRGLSSIPRLKRYPLKALKLDPSLVRGVGKSEESEAIVEAISCMATTLGLEVFARGVEDHAQQAFLRALDCHLQQGPLFGRPMPADDFARYLTLPTQ